MATDSKSPAVVQLFTALEVEGIRFLLVGMSAANLQGVLATTVDVDVWIDLPARQYMRVTNICRKLKATIQSPNNVYLTDDTPIDFIYQMKGLKSFQSEYEHATRISFHGRKILVLPLDRICKSKEIAARDKDKLHVLLIRQVLKLEKAARKAPPKSKGD